MSALGQKKQTCAAHRPMSAKCQERTSQSLIPKCKQKDRLAAVSPKSDQVFWSPITAVRSGIEPGNLVFGSKSRHVQRTHACPLRANSGHSRPRSLRTRHRSRAALPSDRPAKIGHSRNYLPKQKGRLTAASRNLTVCNCHYPWSEQLGLYPCRPEPCLADTTSKAKGQYGRADHNQKFFHGSPISLFYQNLFLSYARINHP